MTISPKKNVIPKILPETWKKLTNFLLSFKTSEIDDYSDEVSPVLPPRRGQRDKVKITVKSFPPRNKVDGFERFIFNTLSKISLGHPVWIITEKKLMRLQDI